MRVSFPLAALLFSVISGDAAAQDALRGKQLYQDVGRLRGSGVSCVDCHGGFPGALSGLGKAAGDPTAIAYAIGAIQQMAPLRGRVTPEDMADIAAFLSAPSIPSPEPRLTTSGPAASPYSSERLEFPELSAGHVTPPSTIRLANLGAAPLKLLSAPDLSGPAAAQFASAATDCAAGATLAMQQSCAIEIVFRPEGEPGLRAAALGLKHDWIRGGFNVALIGRIPSTP
jgi:cytochrome c553